MQRRKGVGPWAAPPSGMGFGSDLNGFVSSYEHLILLGVIQGPGGPVIPLPGHTYLLIFLKWLSWNECSIQIFNDLNGFVSSYKHLTLFGVI